MGNSFCIFSFYSLPRWYKTFRISKRVGISWVIFWIRISKSKCTWKKTSCRSWDIPKCVLRRRRVRKDSPLWRRKRAWNLSKDLLVLTKTNNIHRLSIIIICTLKKLLLWYSIKTTQNKPYLLDFKTLIEKHSPSITKPY